MRSPLLCLVLAAAPALAAQQTGKPPLGLGDITVSTERVTTALAASTASITRLTAEQLEKVPHATIADLLQLAPGFSQVNADGSGADPRVIVRGFYGGGEAEYVVVMVNGRPVNQLNTGVVAWDALPALSSIESIEILRGSSSVQYGDAALGGAINIITRKGARLPANWSIAGGSDRTFDGSLAFNPSVAGRNVTFAGNALHLDGFRDHSERSTGHASIGVPLVASGSGRAGLTLRGDWRSFDEPGALLASLLASSPRASDPLFRFDHTRDNSYQVLVDGEHHASGTSLTGALSSEFRNIGSLKTVALAPGFGDTKDHVLSLNTLGASTQLTRHDLGLSFPGELVLGADLKHGSIDSHYYQVLTGDTDAYREADGARGDLDASGSGSRNAAALYAQAALHPASALRFSLGVRYDWLKDAFDVLAPQTPATLKASHHAFSPKAGLNVQYASGANPGHVYVAASRSFKAPTLDQLFDQRSLPVPFPPYAIQTSNSDLRPQFGTSMEAGIYQGAALTATKQATLSLSTYSIDMKDELDFDVTALTYRNIGKSRHRGVEAGLTVTASDNASMFLNYTVQSATSRSGDNSGKYLKAIPRNTLNAGVSVAPTARSQVGITVTSSRNNWLDDANTVALKPYTTADLRVSYRIGTMTLYGDARNLFDQAYNSGGFLDPAGSGEAYYNPASGRTVSIGLRGGW